MRRLTVMAWNLALVAFIPNAPAHGQHISFSGEHVEDVQVLAEGGTEMKGLPLLDHFDLSFERNDHHILEVLLLPPLESEGGLVSLTDSSSNKYRYDLDWRLLSSELKPLSVSNTFGVCDGGKCSVQLEDHPGNNGGDFVLIGFRLDFSRGDHHIDIISVREKNDVLTVEYRDKDIDMDGDDAFIWYVEFAYIVPQRVKNRATIEGEAEGADSAETGMNPDVVIAGFRFDFDDDDHHIQDLAVDTRQGHTVSVKYNDDNSDDGFTWAVDLVELN